ncbi:MAG: hypothetical protein Q9216_002494 [Gyalolechia sp. 2 TL-2023]
MSDIRGDKRKRDTLEVEQNKRQRLDSELERETYPHLHGHRHRQPQSAGVNRSKLAPSRERRHSLTSNRGRPSSQYQPSQSPVHADASLDEQDNVELLELQSAQIQRRLKEARQRASQRGQPVPISGATQPRHGYLPAQSPTLAYGAGDNRPGGYNTWNVDSHAIHQAHPSINPSTNPRLPGRGTPSYALPGTPLPHPSVRPSQPPESPYTAAPTRPFPDPYGYYPTISNTGKRDRDAWTASNDNSGTKDVRQAQRRKVDISLPAIPSAPSAGTVHSSQPPEEDQLPSSDGVDLLGLDPSRSATNLSQQGGVQPESSVNPYDPLSFIHAFNSTERPANAVDNISAQNPWDAAYNPYHNLSSQPGQQPHGESDIEAQFRALHQGFPPGNWTAAGKFAQPINRYQNQPDPINGYSFAAPLNVADSPESGTQEQRKSRSESKKSQTKRQQKLRRFEEQGMELGNDNKKKGEVHYDGAGNMFCIINGSRLPAAYHHERRNVLLARADREGSYSKSILHDVLVVLTKIGYPSDHGADDHDRMAFHPSYANFNMKVREGRPDILYEWEHKKQKPAPKHPGYMRDTTDGKFLLDVNNHPIRDWPELPATISGQVEGMWIEYWRRLNPQISLPDVVARCPKVTQKHASSKEHKLSIAAFGNRMRRHRVLLGTRAWEEREGSREIATKLKGLMPNRVLAQIAGQNSTKTWRDLTNDEVDMILTVNKGQGSAIARAGDKKLEGLEKAQRDTDTRNRTVGIQRRMETEKQRDDEEYEALLAQRGVDPRIWRQTPVTADQAQEPALDASSSYVQTSNAPDQNSLESGHTMPAADVWGDKSLIMSHQDENSDESTFVEQPLEGTTLVEPFNSAEVSTESEKIGNPGNVGSKGGAIEKPVNVNIAPQGLTEETVDYTLKIPNTIIEFNKMVEALEVTRAAYQQVLGQEPPAPLRLLECSYQDQVNEMQQSFNKHWREFFPHTMPLSLPQRIGWTGSWDAWAAADVTVLDYPQAGAVLDTGTEKLQTTCTEDLEWAQALVSTFGGTGADNEDVANVERGTPVTSNERSSVDHLFEDDGVRTNMDPTGAMADEQETPRDCNPATSEEDAPADFENDFDRMIRESENAPLDFSGLESEIMDPGRLEDMFNGFAGGPGFVSIPDVENSNIGDNSEVPPPTVPAANESTTSDHHSTQPQDQPTQPASFPEVPSIILSSSGPQHQAPDIPQKEDLLSPCGDRQGTDTLLEAGAQAWGNEDMTNEEIDDLFEFVA